MRNDAIMETHLFITIMKITKYPPQAFFMKLYNDLFVYEKIIFYDLTRGNIISTAGAFYETVYKKYDFMKNIFY